MKCESWFKRKKKKMYNQFSEQLVQYLAMNQYLVKMA